ncbi:MAG: hypothetical protein RSC84_02505 [Peptostreptococcaceae bacterium]
MDEKFVIEGFIGIGEYVRDIIFKVPKDSNILREDLEYIKPKETEGIALDMFMASLCNTIRIPAGGQIKTIEVKNRYYEAGLPGMIVELGNCIKVENIE